MLLRANKFRKDKESDCRRNELGSRIFVGKVFGDYAECLHFYPKFAYGRIIAGETSSILADKSKGLSAPWGSIIAVAMILSALGAIWLIKRKH